MFLEDLSSAAQQKLKPTTRTRATVTIASGTAVSPLASITSGTLLGFIAPAAWDTAEFSIDVSTDTSLWNSVEGIITPTGLVTASWSSLTPGAAYAVDLQALLPWSYIRFRSGTMASPVNQSAARTFTIVTRALW